MVKWLREEMELGTWSEALEASHDVLDAAVCVLAGADFQRGQALPPLDLARAKRESWIWCRSGPAAGTAKG